MKTVVKPPLDGYIRPLLQDCSRLFFKTKLKLFLKVDYVHEIANLG